MKAVAAMRCRHQEPDRPASGRLQAAIQNTAMSRPANPAGKHGCRLRVESDERRVTAKRHDHKRRARAAMRSFPTGVDSRPHQPGGLGQHPSDDDPQCDDLDATPIKASS